MRSYFGQSAIAAIKGSAKYPNIKGYAYFTETDDGTAVSIAVKGLPVEETLCKSSIFAVHIHEGGSCSGNQQDLFADTLGHYNPYKCEHPFHAGDMPPLFSAGQKASFAFLTNRFTPDEVIGKTIVIHKSYDDFHTQPSGASGEKIACGEIKPTLD
ncbi:MAG: superoxide dismutase family protein [Ruminococcus sp.]|nr:superoxide dismutase family protein [Ruminococcus sp.]